MTQHIVVITTLVTIALISLIYIIFFEESAEASDGVYACIFYDGNLMLEGRLHPAALEGGPFNGPSEHGLEVVIGENCAGEPEAPSKIPDGQSQPSATPAPATATPIPATAIPATPIPTPTPVPEPPEDVCSIDATISVERSYSSLRYGMMRQLTETLYYATGRYEGYRIGWLGKRGEYPCVFWDEWGIHYVHG